MEVNIPAGRSETWNDLYNEFADGNAIPPPYHDVKVTDPTKLATMTQAYSDYRNGVLPSSELPDIRDVFLTEKEWAMGFAPRPDSSPQEVLIQACAQCHNEKLDQTISKSDFSVNIQSLDSEQKEEAIERLQLPDDHIKIYFIRS